MTVEVSLEELQEQQLAEEESELTPDERAPQNWTEDPQ